MGRVIFLIGIVIFLPALAEAQWETFGGNSRHDGQVGAIGPEDAGIAWENLSLTGSWGGPMLADEGLLALMRFSSDNAPLECIDAATGYVLWTLQFPQPAGTCALPVGFRDGRLYVLEYFNAGGAGSLHAVDPENGDVLWTSPYTAQQSIATSAVFAPDGDLIVNGPSNDIVRIDALTGNIVWQADRHLPATNGVEALAAHEDRLFGWNGLPDQPLFLTAWDMEGGDELYALEMPGWPQQQVPISISPQGRLWVLRQESGMFGIDDTGSSLEIVWQIAYPTGWEYPFCSNFATGIDGHVLVPWQNGRLYKLHRDTGAILAMSEVLTTGGSMMMGRTAIDAEGTIYFGNGAGDDGAVFALDANDLSTQWSWQVEAMTYGGPVMDEGGDLYVNGAGGVTSFAGRGDADMPPTEFRLVYPEHNGEIYDVDFDFHIPFGWEVSTDPDPDDSVHYLLRFFEYSRPEYPELTFDSLSVPEFMIHQYSLMTVPGWEDFSSYWDIQWSAWAISGEDTVQASDGWWRYTYIYGYGVREKPAALVTDGCLRIHPNPANGQAVVEVELARPGQADLKLFDRLGREVLSVNDISVFNRQARVALPLDGIASGTYLVRVDADNGFVQSRRLTVLK